MKLNRMAALLTIALMAAACGGAPEEEAPAMDEAPATTPEPAPVPAPADTTPPDTTTPPTTTGQ